MQMDLHRHSAESTGKRKADPAAVATCSSPKKPCLVVNSESDTDTTVHTSASESPVPSHTPHGDSSPDIGRPPIERAIALLVKRGAYGNPDAPELQWLREPSSAKADKISYYERAHVRAVRLYTADASTHAEATPLGAHSFSPTEFPGYDSGTLVMINTPLTSVQRWQRSSLCYMHAGVVSHYYALWHYKLNKHAAATTDAKDAAATTTDAKDAAATTTDAKDAAATTTHAMIDMQKDIRKRFDAEALHRHVFDDKGGDSQVYMESLLLTDSTLTSSVPMEWYGDYLRLYGPALVSRFKVHEDFSSHHSVHHHYGKKSGKYIGRHAMVLVGARKDVMHGWCFLLQNWWFNKQFVEVSAEYLQSCGATVLFILTPQDHMNKDLPTVQGRWFECDMLDKPECLHGEDM
jgi:hypothetical protein